MPVTKEDYRSDVENAWCPGCGNLPILNVMKQVLVDLDLPPHRVLMCSGIGQAPKLPHYLRINTFNGLHGREVASAQGAKLAADDLIVIVHAGEGGAYGEGGNHLLHAVRRNVDMTVIVHDNTCYALTKGQASPTTPYGTVTAIETRGVMAEAMNPLALAISQNCGFVAQSTSADIEHLASMVKAAIHYKGFSLINVLQPCITYDKVHTYKFYRDNCYKLGEEHDPADRMAALKLVLMREDRIPIGIIYKCEHGPAFEEQMLRGIKHPLRERGVDPQRAERLFDLFK